MPAYQYVHEACGMTQQLFLKTDREFMDVPCLRCGRNVTAKQVRDKSLTYHEKDGTIGILRHDRQQNN